MADDSTLERLQNCLDRLRAGDAEARNEIVRHGQERLRRLTRHMLRDFPAVRRREETSDVLQNVLLRLDKALRELDLQTPRDFLSLAAAHIRWELLDLARSHGHASRLNADLATPPEPSDSSADPYKLALWQEVHSHIAALPEEERLLFDLLYYQGLTQSEAATLLAKPLRTLKLHWQKARLRLMERLGGEIPF